MLIKFPFMECDVAQNYEWDARESIINQRHNMAFNINLNG